MRRFDTAKRIVGLVAIFVLCMDAPLRADGGGGDGGGISGASATTGVPDSALGGNLWGRGIDRPHLFRTRKHVVHHRPTRPQVVVTHAAPPRSFRHVVARLTPRRRRAMALVSFPPAGETRFRPSEILVEVARGASEGAIDAIVRRHGLTDVASSPIALLGSTLHLWRAADGRSTVALMREVSREPLLARIQPNYVYTLAADATTLASLPQYALAHIHADTTRTLATGDKVRIAIIDSAIDERHPDLAGAIEARFDAVGTPATPHPHGTAMAGAIAARGSIEGAAPHARLLAVRAFDLSSGGADGTSLTILKGIDWAVTAQARIINMSFAGPADPAMLHTLVAASQYNVLLVAAAGNAGPNAAPLYPAADPDVLAVSATDSSDRFYANASRGALAAPGVDVLLPAPDGKYDLETGTSVSAALASGVAALVLEREPTLSAPGLRDRLKRSAASFGSSGRIEGLLDAARALAGDDISKASTR